MLTIPKDLDSHDSYCGTAYQFQLGLYFSTELKVHKAAYFSLLYVLIDYDDKYKGNCLVGL